MLRGNRTRGVTCGNRTRELGESAKAERRRSPHHPMHDVTRVHTSLGRCDSHGSSFTGSLRELVTKSFSDKSDPQNDESRLGDPAAFTKNLEKTAYKCVVTCNAGPAKRAALASAQCSAATPARHCDETNRYTTAFMTQVHYTPRAQSVKRFRRSIALRGWQCGSLPVTSQTAWSVASEPCFAWTPV